METLLDFHYSDNWADPGAQEIPAAWASIESDEELAQALYDYTYDTLMDLHSAGLMPDFVQVGNETNPGLLKGASMRQDSARDALLFNAGIRAVRAAAEAAGSDTRVLLHVAQPENTGWWFREAAAAGITDFDLIGISYYPQWSSFSISGLASQVADLRRMYGKDVMILETGYPWTLEGADEAGNVLTQGQRAYPLSPEGQLKFMQDLSQALRSSGALGSVYWEPAWVSTGCSTRWGQGSHWENAAFFDFQDQNELLPVIGYMQQDYATPPEAADGVLEAEYHLLAEDVVGDTSNGRAELDLVSLHAYVTDGYLHLALGMDGELLANAGSIYRIYFDTNADGSGGNVDIGDRLIVVADPHQAEYVLEVQIVEAAGTVVPEGAWFRWDGAAWQESAFVGSLAAAGGTLEAQLASAWLGDVAGVNVAALSAGRVLNRSAADILGGDPTPAEPTATAELHSFLFIELAE
jgi:arabinogalactan endo-1,4-beta-galactosidase